MTKLMEHCRSFIPCYIGRLTVGRLGKVAEGRRAGTGRSLCRWRSLGNSVPYLLPGGKGIVNASPFIFHSSTPAPFSLWDCAIVALCYCGIVPLYYCGIVGLWDCGIVGLWDCTIEHFAVLKSPGPTIQQFYNPTISQWHNLTMLQSHN